MDECFCDGARLVSVSTACCVLWLVASSKTAQQSFVQFVFFLCERDGWILAMERASHQRLTLAAAVFTLQFFWRSSLYEASCVCSMEGLVHRICHLSKCLGMARVCLRRGGSLFESTVQLLVASHLGFFRCAVCWPCKKGIAAPNVSGPISSARSLHKIVAVRGALANQREAALAEQLALVQALLSSVLLIFRKMGYHSSKAAFGHARP